MQTALQISRGYDENWWFYSHCNLTPQTEIWISLIGDLTNLCWIVLWKEFAPACAAHLGWSWRVVIWGVCCTSRRGTWSCLPVVTLGQPGRGWSLLTPVSQKCTMALSTAPLLHLNMTAICRSVWPRSLLVLGSLVWPACFRATAWAFLTSLKMPSICPLPILELCVLGKLCGRTVHLIYSRHLSNSLSYYSGLLTFDCMSLFEFEDLDKRLTFLWNFDG